MVDLLLGVFIAFSNLLVPFLALTLLLTVNAIIGWFILLLFGFKTPREDTSFFMLMWWEVVLVIYWVRKLEDYIEKK